MTTLRPNLANLARVRDRIAEVGNEHCDMSNWTIGIMPGSGEPPCGTTACIAGHAQAIRMGKASPSTVRASDEALWLGVPHQLFYEEMWPLHYQNIAHEEGDAKGMLAILDAILDGTEIHLRDYADGCYVINPVSTVAE